jgi:hypothetical protein
MRKRLVGLFMFGLVFSLLFVFSSGFISAALNDTLIAEKTNQAYSWLNHETAGNSSKFSSQDNSFLLLALSYDNALANELRTSLNSQSKSEECWPSTGCNVRDTALAALSLQRVCNSNTDIDDWILTQTSTPTEILWYLQVEAINANATCTASYDGRDYDFKISDNRKLEKSAGPCLTATNDNYWFKVPQSCYNKTFSITCSLGNAQDEFLTSWFYQKPADTTSYISSDTQKESSGGVVETGINAKCFKSGSTCDYESTAWAALYLLKQGQEIGMFLPYLIGYADKNSAKLPEAFLYILTGNENYAEQLLTKQKSTGYWQATSKNDKYYDTALALMALNSYTSASELIDKAKSWLIKEAKSEKINNQITYSSWGTSKKITSFVLYSVWPKEPVCLDSDTVGCEDMGFDCVSIDDCDSDGIVNYFCTYSSQVCCNDVLPKKTCDDFGGDLCGYYEECLGTYEYVDEGTCCLDKACTEKYSEETECEEEGNICRSTCGYGYTETEDYDCEYGEVCCEEETIPSCTEKADCDEGQICDEGVCVDKEVNLTWLWILIMVVVIVLLILLFLNFKKKKSVSGYKPKPHYGYPGSGYPPASPPVTMTRRQPQQPPSFRTMIPSSGAPIRRPISKSSYDRELEETMRKVKEITK